MDNSENKLTCTLLHYSQRWRRHFSCISFSKMLKFNHKVFYVLGKAIRLAILAVDKPCCKVSLSSETNKKSLSWKWGKNIEVYLNTLILKVSNKNCSSRHFKFLLLSFWKNKTWFFLWILCLAEDSLETSSLIFSEKQWKNIYECRLLQSWLAL